MKLNKILELFNERPQGAPEAIGRKVFKSIPDFARRVEMMSHMDEMEKICELYHEDEQAEIKRLIQQYCDEQNKQNDDKPGYEPLVLGKNITRVPNEKTQELMSWREERLNKDIKIKPFTFTPEEIKAANLTVDELLEMKDFYNMTELKKFTKDKKP